MWKQYNVRFTQLVEHEHALAKDIVFDSVYNCDDNNNDIISNESIHWKEWHNDVSTDQFVLLYFIHTKLFVFCIWC